MIEIGRMPNGQTIGEYWKDFETGMEELDAAFDDVRRKLSELERLPSFPRWLFGRGENSLIGCLRKE